MEKEYGSSANEMTIQFAEPGRIFWKGVEGLGFSVRMPSTEIPALCQLVQGYPTPALSASAGIVSWQ